MTISFLLQLLNIISFLKISFFTWPIEEIGKKITINESLIKKKTFSSDKFVNKISYNDI